MCVRHLKTEKEGAAWDLFMNSPIPILYVPNFSLGSKIHYLIPTKNVTKTSEKSLHFLGRRGCFYWNEKKISDGYVEKLKFSQLSKDLIPWWSKN